MIKGLDLGSQEFIPVLFGSDRNVYGMAVGFYLEYHIKSIAVCKAGYGETRYSQLLEIYQNSEIEKKEVFFGTLEGIRKKYSKAKLILIACSDVYARLIVENKPQLEKDFIVPYISEEMMNKLIIKENFYKTCEEHGLDYPRTFICTREIYNDIKLPFDFPIIVKPSDSVSYWKSSFEGKKKIFVVYKEEEFRDILRRVYGSEYQGDLIIQEYIEGDDSALRVLNAYVDHDHKVTFMALGQIVLEDKAPASYGDYDAIVPAFDQKLFDTMKAFLESIDYVGYANFDLKYNAKTGGYKLFEINIRQGRSHSFVTLGGLNLPKYLVEDVIYHRSGPTEYLRADYLWAIVPKRIVLHYTKNAELKERCRQYYKEGKVKNILYFKEDLTFKRRLVLARKISDKKYYLYYK